VKYEQGLAFQLRLRGRDEQEIAEILRELRAHGVAPGELENEFGTPEEYASGFEKSKRKTLGSRVTVWGVIAAVTWVLAWIAIGLVRKHVLGIEPPLEGIIAGPLISVGSLAIVAAGLLGGFLTDLLRPAPRV
jgi:hypothetical protein